MRTGSLLSFTGNYLQIVGTPKQDGETLRVDMRGEQQNPAFLDVCKQEIAKTIVVARRLLLARGITLETDEMDLESNTLVVHARLHQIQNGVDDHLLPLMEEGMYIAKPHHFDGRAPITADRLHFALSQGFLDMEDEHIDRLPDHPDATEFVAPSTHGTLLYYPEAQGDQRQQLLRDRLFLQPGKTHEQTAPVWQPIENKGLLMPGQFIARRVQGIRTRFHSVLVHPKELRQYIVADARNGSFTAFDTVPSSRPFDPADIPPVRYSLYDHRPAHLLAPERQEESAQLRLTESYAAADTFLRTLERHSEGEEQGHTSALVLNTEGLQRIGQGEEEWIRRSGHPTDEEQHDRRARLLHSSLAPQPTAIFDAARKSSAMRLLRKAGEEGMDAGALLVSEALPSHAALKSLLEVDVQQGRRAVTGLLIRRPSMNHGNFFSGHDYHALMDCCNKGIDVYWANENMQERAPGQPQAEGSLLQLAQLCKGEQRSLVFIPPHRIREFLEGIHIAAYGTARTLRPEYIQFTKEFFAHLKRMNGHKPMVIHSGGGPDASTMGVFNRGAMEHDCLSIGHVLDVSKEPTNRYLDGIMPFRNEARDLRQGNMARAATGGVIQLEGGGGTREERGIAETDVAILTGPMPIILVGDEFYENEYRQHLVEVEQGTLDAKVLQCISLLGLDQAEEAAKILLTFANTGKVINVIPKRFESNREAALKKHAEVIGKRTEAWKTPGSHSDNGRKSCPRVLTTS